MIPHQKYFFYFLNNFKNVVSLLGEANNEIQWSRLNGQTPSTNTGPTNDHTQNNGWCFVFSSIFNDLAYLFLFAVEIPIFVL